MQGKIVKGIAGFYYVNVNGTEYECKAKGVFRKDHKKPLVGDDCLLDILDEDKRLGNIREIMPRRSELIRPAVANVDQALVIFALTSPQPNLNLLDRFLIMMEQQKLPCIICFNKLDLDTDRLAEQYADIYAACGYEILVVSAKEGKGVDKLRKRLEGKITTVAGPSGVGKSSLINCLLGNSVMETGQLSKKIDRGKHTTRHSQLLQLEGSGYIFDTPGFSSLDLWNLEKEDLAGYYREFGPYERECRFGGCSHISEPICGIKTAVSNGNIARQRYENYCQLYMELKNQKRY